VKVPRKQRWALRGVNSWGTVLGSGSVNDLESKDRRPDARVSPPPVDSGEWDGNGDAISIDAQGSSCGLPKCGT
jgi:hypothetical protein